MRLIAHHSRNILLDTDTSYLTGYDKACDMQDHGYHLRDARYASLRYVPLRFVTLIYDFVTLVTLRYVTSRYVTKYSIFC